MKKTVYIIILTCIIILLGSFYYIYVFRNPQKIIESKIEDQFRSDMMMKAVLFDNTLAQQIQGAKSISSRSMIRKKIVEYKNGKISFEELESYTKQKYIDGVSALENVLYAQRYVDSLLLVNTTTESCKGLNEILKDTAKNELLAKIDKKQNATKTHVISPITDGTRIVGYDILCFDNSGILTEIADSSIQFSVVSDIELNGILDSMTYTTEYANLYIKSKQTDDHFCFSIPTKVLFSELTDFTKKQLLITILLIISLTLGLYIIIRRNKLLALSKSKYLEDLVKTKTAELQGKVNQINKLNTQLSGSNEELNATVEELNAINDELTDVNKAINKERKQFLSVLDSIPEIIYVADIDTHEVLFANNKLKSIVGRDITGEKCFEAIQNSNKECSFCSNLHIKDTQEPYFWGILIQL
ncbi:MAG: hypothetical protein R6U85_10345 [Salinivirgaceae bacterium]